MEEQDFWARLEYRVCREFVGMPDTQLRSFGAMASSRKTTSSMTARHVSLAGLGFAKARGKTNGTSRSFLPHPVDSPDKIDWASLLPAENVTRWLAVDQHDKRIQIEPSAAVPDSA